MKFKDSKEVYTIKTAIPDLSHYNETIDWDKAKEHAPFVILRASVGVNRDTRYMEFAEECDARSIPYHAYHYLKAMNMDEAIREASVFYGAAAGTKPLFYIVDCEYDPINEMAKTDHQAVRTITECFINELKRIAGRDIGIACYIGQNNYKRWGLDYSKFDYVWIPSWGEDDGLPHTPPKYECDLWQYTSNGRVDYVSDDTDLNLIQGNKPIEFFTGKLNLKLGERELSAGCTGADVKELQLYLDKLGYDLGIFGEEGNGVDGEYGEWTETAVKAFQDYSGIQATGIFGKREYELLKNKTAESDNGKCMVVVKGSKQEMMTVRNEHDGEAVDLTNGIFQVVRDIFDAVLSVYIR